MKHLIISSSLHAASKSRTMAEAALTHFTTLGQNAEIIDLRDFPLPLCDGGAAYGDPAIQPLAAKIAESASIIVATPIYNFDTNAAFKNLVELTSRAWTDKLVGFICAAGGQASYMSVMAMANSLMLDFRCLIIPRFVYATGDQFSSDGDATPPVVERIEELVGEAVRISTGLSGSSPQ